MDNTPTPTRRPPVSAGFVTTGTLIIAAVSALVLATGCRTEPRAAGTEASANACAVGTMAPLLPFDEQFYVPAMAAGLDAR